MHASTARHCDVFGGQCGMRLFCFYVGPIFASFKCRLSTIAHLASPFASGHFYLFPATQTTVDVYDLHVYACVCGTFLVCVFYVECTCVCCFTKEPLLVDNGEFNLNVSYAHP